MESCFKCPKRHACYMLRELARLVRSWSDGSNVNDMAEELTEKMSVELCISCNIKNLK